jgi:hypothetical protein
VDHAIWQRYDANRQRRRVVALALVVVTLVVALAGTSRFVSAALRRFIILWWRLWEPTPCGGGVGGCPVA